MKILEQWNRISTAKKASFALVFANFFQKGITMISTPIFTRLMATEQYGAITNFISWQNIIVIIATLNLSQGVFNNGMLDFRDDRNRFISSLMVLSNSSTIIFFGLYFLFHSVLNPAIGLSDSLMFIMMIYMLFYPAYSFWSCKQRYEYRYKLLTILTLSNAILQMALSIIAVVVADNSMQSYYKIMSTEVVLIIIGVIIYISILKKSSFKINIDYIKYAFKFNIFLLPHFLAMNVLASGDKVMITSMVGKRETAIYGVSYTAASVILIFWQAIEASWTPWLFEHLNSGDKKPIKNRANQIITMFAIISVACILFAPEIIRILASNEYLDGIYIIPSVTAGVYFTAVYALYMRIEYYSKKTKATMVGSVIVAMANVILNYIFIQMIGYLAAGYTTLVCYILLYLFHFWYTRKIGMIGIYDDKYIFVLSVVMIVISIVVTYTYSLNILRYIIILGLLIVCVFIRKLIRAHIKAIIK